MTRTKRKRVSLAQFIDLMHKQVLTQRTTSALGEVIGSHEVEPQDLEPYIHYQPDFYTRNLIYRNSAWELMLLCWESGHYSPVHDHNGGGGWFLTLQGEIQETVCQLSLEEKIRITHKDDKLVKPDQVSYIDDRLGVHSLASPNTRSLTLHLYAPPIDICRFFDEEAGVLRPKELSFFNVDARL